MIMKGPVRTTNITDTIFRGKIAVVTGSSGFVGQRLVKALAEKGAKVVELDVKDGVDLTDWNHVSKIGSFDLLFHLAAKTFVPDSYQNPRDFYYTNIIGTLNILELCRIHKAKIVFASSYVYGNPEYLPVDENHPIDAFNPYAQTKIVGEQLCEGYHRDFGVPVVILRPFNIYGTGQNENFLIPSIIKQAKSGLILLKDPDPKRDMLFVDDVVDAYMKAAEYDQNDCDVFNIGSGKSYSVREIVDNVVGFFDHEIDVKFSGEKRKNEVLDTIADISKAKNLLNWEPKTDLRDGLHKSLAQGQLEKNYS